MDYVIDLDFPCAGQRNDASGLPWARPVKSGDDRQCSDDISGREGVPADIDCGRVGRVPEDVAEALRRDGCGDSSVDGRFGFVRAFVGNMADLDTAGTTALRVMNSGGLMWFYYPITS